MNKSDKGKFLVHEYVQWQDIDDNQELKYDYVADQILWMALITYNF